ncbi:hypothetical protein [Duganella vulcania]|uniref:Uncharacterized protein n=1 Tax=Duganella vulcania TaxID=2692166 RepID=A0A845GID1_9BURK|nr:hypothetical protein [Duganella vulcania]MYM92818.1 hypothetical protein [Duganella vulcania]
MAVKRNDSAVCFWQNGPGEIVCARFDDQVRQYWRNVAQPALASADREVEMALAATETDVSAVFEHADRVDQHQVTALGLGIALQSLWERQLRRYLCAYVQGDAAMRKKVEMAKWDQLLPLFEQFRGAPLRAFICFPDLDLLSLVGNVCRHGDGKTADLLWRSHPELWPYSQAHDHPDAAPPVEHMHLSTSLLSRLADSVTKFWEFVSYLHLENLLSKHPSVERRLPTLRALHEVEIAHFNRTCSGIARA